MAKKDNYDDVLNFRLTQDMKVLFKQLESIMRTKTGMKIPKTHVVRHAIAIARDFYSGETNYGG
ncbi:MAG: hypothetical protein ACP5D6_06400 [Kosmotogaceae bacterium]